MKKASEYSSARQRVPRTCCPIQQLRTQSRPD